MPRTARPPLASTKTPKRRAASAGQTAEPGLRERILATGRALLEARGPAALSMREVAREAGVTHQAPYHHFANREAILAEIVALGFDELADGLATANASISRKGRRAGAVASGMAYVGFALANPGLFRIMFRHDAVDPSNAPGAQRAGDRAHGELLRMVELVHGRRDNELAAVYWAQAHGLACLLIDGPPSTAMPRAARLAYARSTLERFAGALVRDE